jgi:hypothetical protein
LLSLIFGAGGLDGRSLKPSSAMVKLRCLLRRLSTVLFGLSVVGFLVCRPRKFIHNNNNNKNTATISSSESDEEDGSTTAAVAPRRTSGINRSNLPYSVEEAILKSLVPPDCAASRFRFVCDCQPSLFGANGSKLRRSIIQRRCLLKRRRNSNYSNFTTYCGVFGIKAPKSLQEILELEGVDDESVAPERASSDRIEMTPIKSPPALMLKNTPNNDTTGKYNIILNTL